MMAAITLTEIAGSLKHSCAGQWQKRVNLRDSAGQVGIVPQKLLG